MTAPAPAADVVRRVRHPLVARRLEVTRVETLSPVLRRVVLDGPDLAGFVAEGPADHCKVFFPAEPGGAVVHPVLEDGAWVNRADGRLVYRDFTVRTYTPGEGLVLDMVVHEHGPAGRWAAQAAPGQELGVLGPRGSALPPLDRDRYLLASDMTGLPAVLNWLDRLPESAHAQVVVEIGADDERIHLGHRAADVQVTWVSRNDAAPGTTTHLQDAVVGAIPDWLDQTTPDRVWAFAAGEATAVRAIRTALREAGLDRTSFHMTGYWRLGVVNFDHHSPEA